MLRKRKRQQIIIPENKCIGCKYHYISAIPELNLYQDACKLGYTKENCKLR